MVQLHCEIKSDMYQKFKENGALRVEKRKINFDKRLF